MNNPNLLPMAKWGFPYSNDAGQPDDGDDEDLVGYGAGQPRVERC